MRETKLTLVILVSLFALSLITVKTLSSSQHKIRVGTPVSFPVDI